jgi:hypothetical protein
VSEHEVVALERRRLEALVEVDVATAEELHHPSYVLVHPSGGRLTGAEYLGMIASGDMDYRRFEPISEVEVLAGGDVVALRYRAAIEISVWGRPPGALTAWHLDCWQRDEAGRWQARWSQATEEQPPL